MTKLKLKKKRKKEKRIINQKKIKYGKGKPYKKEFESIGCLKIKGKYLI